MTLVAVATMVVAVVGSLESGRLGPLVDRASGLSDLLPRLYVMTPADVHLASRSHGIGFARLRVPVDGWAGLSRMASLLIAALCFTFGAPDEGFGYPLVAGLVLYAVAIEAMSAVRSDLLVHDRSPLTVPLERVTRQVLRWGISGVSVYLGGVLVGTTIAPTVGWLICAVGMAIIAALVSTVARELRFVEILFDGGAEILGLTILARLAGPASLSAFGSAATRHAMVTGESTAWLVAVVAVATCVGLTSYIVRSR